MIERVVALLAVLGAFVAACSSGDAQCRVGADCASGACDATGRCVAAPPHGDAGFSVDASASDSASGDSSSTTDGATVDGGACAPNKDGTITREEIPLGPGLHATYRVAENVTWNTAGTTKPDGTRHWDLSTALSGDHTVVIETTAIPGQWFAADFTGATYSTKLSDTSDLLGVFETQPSQFLLRGVVSPSGGNSRTELTYAPAVPTLVFPLQKGASWNVNTAITGVANGIGSAYGESYQYKVDAVGDVATPYGTFAVQRVQVVLTRNVGGIVTVTRTYVLVAECFGPVANIVSQANELNAEFTNVAELRRLSP